MDSGTENAAFSDTEKEGNEKVNDKEIQMDSEKSVQKSDNSPEKEKSAQKSEDSSEKKEAAPSPKRRRIVIEPALALCFMFQISSFSLGSQYTYYAIGERHNLSLFRNDSASGDGSMCNGNDDEESPGYLAQQAAQRDTARFNFFMDLITDIPGFFILLFFGTLIDRLGRKPGMIISMLGMIFRCLVYITQQVLDLPLEVVYISGIVEALTGGFVTFISSCYAHLVDTVSPRERGKRIAFSDAATGFSVGIMSMLMGLMISSWGFMWPFIVVIAGHTINLIYIIFFVEETVRKTEKKRSISPKYIIDSFKVIPKYRPDKGRLLLGVLLASWMCMHFSKVGTRGIENLYKLNSPFCWSSVTLGAVSGTTAILTNIVQIFVAVFLFKPLGAIGVVYLGMSSMALDFFITGFATKSWMLYVAPVFGSGQGVTTPFVRAIMANIVGKTEQGGLLQSITAMEKVIGLGASSFYNFVYGATLDVFKGTVFLVMGSMMIVSLLLVMVYDIILRRQQKDTDLEENVKDVTVSDQLSTEKGVELTRF